MHVPISGREGTNLNGSHPQGNACSGSHQQQQQQHEIVVQPEFVFEATAHFTNSGSGQVVSSGANAAHSVTPTPEVSFLLIIFNFILLNFYLFLERNFFSLFGIIV